MNTAEFTYLLSHPESTSNSQSLELESVLKEYPYFQSARSLYLKSLQLQNNFKFNSQLKLTAVHTTDRSVLFDFLNSEQFKVIIPRQQSEDHTALIALENDTISNQDFEITQEEVSTTDAINAFENSFNEDIATEISITEAKNDETIFLESPLEKSVMDSILIANEKTVIEETKAIDSNIQLDSPLEKSILSSIKEAESEEQQLKSTPEVFKEKTSWLEDSLDYDSIPIAAENEAIELTEENKETPELSTESTTKITDTKSATLSFQEWLQVSQIKPIERTETTSNTHEEIVIQETETTKTDIETITEAKSDTKSVEIQDGEQVIPEEKTTVINTKMDLIDKFIETNPKIAPVKDHVPPPSYIAKKPDSPYLMTETLAKIYLEQKKYTKAIQAYEILILKYPEKSSLFADRILDIKELQQNNNR